MCLIIFKMSRIQQKIIPHIQSQENYNMNEKDNQPTPKTVLEWMTG